MRKINFDVCMYACFDRVLIERGSRPETKTAQVFQVLRVDMAMRNGTVKFH